MVARLPDDDSAALGISDGQRAYGRQRLDYKVEMQRKIAPEPKSENDLGRASSVSQSTSFDPEDTVVSPSTP